MRSEHHTLAVAFDEDLVALQAVVLGDADGLAAASAKDLGDATFHGAIYIKGVYQQTNDLNDCSLRSTSSELAVIWAGKSARGEPTMPHPEGKNASKGVALSPLNALVYASFFGLASISC